jgi:hypothetical protein
VEPQEPTQQDQDRVLAQLKMWRERLVDLSRGNPLLGINRSRTSKLRIVDPGPSDLFDALALRGEKLKLPIVRRRLARVYADESSVDAVTGSPWIIEPGDVQFEEAREAIEAQGAPLWYRPADSPDLTPIEAACSKVNAALRTRGPRTVEAQSTAVWAARRTITPQDAAGWIAHAGDGPRRRRPTRSTRRRPTPSPASRVPDAPPVITLQVPTPILFDHLW